MWRFVFVTGDYARPESYQFLMESRQPALYEVETLLAVIATVLQQAGRHRVSGEAEGLDSQA